ncbi:MAG TPA: efflux RND transporter periplasmic adaptor subunit [Anaerolineales bacterium]|nr:efflux RND transporter periplasmic adaptor subunit [Anaerolineales bacterium]
MHPNPRRVLPVVLILALAGFGYWYFFGGGRTSATNDVISASGTIETVQVSVNPELGGRVAAVNVDEGDTVKAGDVLVQLDATLLEAQRAQAAAALASATANYESLKDGAAAEQLKAAEAQAKLGVLAAQQALQSLQDSAALAAAQAQQAVAQAQNALTKAEKNLGYARNPAGESLYDAVSDTKLALDNAQANLQLANVDPNVSAYNNAVFVTNWYQRRWEEAKAKYDASNGAQDLKDAMDQAWDAYQSKLNDQLALQLRIDTNQVNKQDTVAKAQEAYDEAVTNLNDALKGPDADKLALAQANVALAEAALKDAQTRAAKLAAGPDPDQLALAEARLTSAQAALKAAQAALSPEQLNAARSQMDAAQAAMDLLEVQIKKLTLTAPVDGVVLSRAIEPGEVASPGAVLLVLGQLSDLTITVYVPEDRYGDIALGRAARVSVDSFSNETFTATVTHIADQAEFTPRNVQTAEGRKTTVFAVKLSIDNPGGRLKPGMPADVKFGDG